MAEPGLLVVHPPHSVGLSGGRSGVHTALHLAHQFVCGYIGNAKKELYIQRKKKKFVFS